MPTEILFTVQSIGNRKFICDGNYIWKHQLKHNSTSCMLIKKWAFSKLSFLKILFLPRTAHTLASWSDVLFQNVSFLATQYRIDRAISPTNSIFILFWPPAILSHSKLREIKNFLQVSCQCSWISLGTFWTKMGMVAVWVEFFYFFIKTRIENKNILKCIILLENLHRPCSSRLALDIQVLWGRFLIIISDSGRTLWIY